MQRIIASNLFAQYNSQRLDKGSFKSVLDRNNVDTYSPDFQRLAGELEQGENPGMVNVRTFLELLQNYDYLFGKSPNGQQVIPSNETPAEKKARMKRKYIYAQKIFEALYVVMTRAKVESTQRYFGCSNAVLSTQKFYQGLLGAGIDIESPEVIRLVSDLTTSTSTSDVDLTEFDFVIYNMDSIFVKILNIFFVLKKKASLFNFFQIE